MPEHIIYAFLGCQVFFVVFVTLHDCIPGGEAFSTRKFFVTAFSGLPFVIGLVASAHYASSARFPMWVMWWLWVCYGSAAYGMLRAWWVPYLAAEPMVDARGGAMFSRPRACAFLGRGLLMNSLHISIQAAASMTLVLLSVLTFSGGRWV